MRMFMIEINCSKRISDGVSNEAMVPKIVAGVVSLMEQGCDRVVIRDQHKNEIGSAAYFDAPDVPPPPTQHGTVDVAAHGVVL